MIFIFWVVLAVLAALIHLGRTRGEERAPGEVAGIFLRYWLGIAVGIAGLVGASRERVNKAIAMFTRLGWVETTGRGHYHILDRESLAQRAEQ